MPYPIEILRSADKFLAKLSRLVVLVVTISTRDDVYEVLRRQLGR